MHRGAPRGQCSDLCHARAEGTVTFTFTDPSGKVVRTQDAELGSSSSRRRALLQRQRRRRTATITVSPGVLGRVTITANFTPRNSRGRPTRAPPIIIVIVNPPTPGGAVIIKCAPGRDASGSHTVDARQLGSAAPLQLPAKHLCVSSRRGSMVDCIPTH
jgi:hypothetical protein